jgi:hypothetical protein
VHIFSERKNVMQSQFIMTEKIRNDEELQAARENLRTIYREIVRLVMKKEEFEERIEEYLNKK